MSVNLLTTPQAGFVTAQGLGFALAHAAGGENLR